MSTEPNPALQSVGYSPDDIYRYFEALVESSDDAILTKDLNGVIRSWNRGAESIFGYTAAEVIGKSVTILIPKGHENEEPEILGRIRRGEKTDHYETIRQRKDGSLINISLTVSPIKNSAGEVIGASKIARDITEQKRARQELAALNAELEQRVQRRTELLRQAVAQMEEFSYSLSHDLRSPVRAIQGYTVAVLEDYGSLLDETGRDYLQRVIRSSMRMDKLILDVLGYAQVANAQIELRPVELEPLIRDLIEERPEMQPPRAQITVMSPLGSVLGHQTFLIQALSNLLSNAVKFIAPGTIPRPEIVAERGDGKIRLWIRDNGIGVGPEMKSRIFGMFERATQDPRYEGTGIGLAIVRKSIEKMGGTVGFESHEKGGTSFWIELPAVPDISQHHDSVG